MTTEVVGANDGLSHALARHLNAQLVSPDSPITSGLNGTVVVAGVPDQTSLNDVDSATWRRLVHDPLLRTIWTFQRAYAAMRDRGGRIVLIVPTVGLAGAANLVPYTTALEGMRAMAKSAARQWSRQGVLVNTVAVPLRLLGPSMTNVDNHLTAPAVNNADALIESVAETTRFLLRRDVDHLVGQTISVDGGSVMLP
ncbi:SDR family oxidoreductase [Mycolicibacterium sp.]|uniref:SDR family oxidoreductase n=1 Tax=Mycolicibacterium sp. TaxID=2320850 RepID=UPI0037CAF71F